MKTCLVNRTEIRKGADADGSDVPIINEILDVLKKQKGLTYVEAYGILQGVRKILEYESNFLLVQVPMTKQ
ncbi:MAG: hypothetical protein SPG03_03270 [Veillonella caviae]|uniref:hypothetical protein n=1 Tax=Veillonella caviae TaxID=248316 RepID=UPI002A91540A|nr:hypothetical protein [Veillonella caviae]MDY5481393.1 hypothetical protein [Veillonella caviae]